MRGSTYWTMFTISNASVEIFGFGTTGKDCTFGMLADVGLVELQERQQAPTTSKQTCGYNNGDPNQARTADAGMACRFDTSNGIWGFCPQTVIAASVCGLAGNCQDSHTCTQGCGLLSAPASISTISCGPSLFCSTLLLDAGVDQTYSYIACGPSAITATLFASTTIAKTTATPSSSSPSVSSTSPSPSISSSILLLSPTPATASSLRSIVEIVATSLPSAPPLTKEPSSINIGGIVGGVLGGLALVAGFVDQKDGASHCRKYEMDASVTKRGMYRKTQQPPVHELGDGQKSRRSVIYEFPA
ncbi:hypothetical protein HYFRA_00004569 [Hymenoscyphus fraxineus]|uniref:Uncharacterized protein n=1 Tax=Hymenoscyphus fraxineus TaxID=746836 RepID=A0A9N9KXL1_9HELO|nr:hypothetical protein HYFRA_00004569 [Hymenoscyphus fraxineus]